LPIGYCSSDHRRDQDKGGIIIPDTAREKPIEGQGRAVGKGKRPEDGRLLPTRRQGRDKVIYGKWWVRVKLDARIT